MHETAGGEYAQVRGDSSSDEFLDVYRRCLVVFFVSAREANPGARLVLVMNREDAGQTEVAGVLRALLSSLGVEVMTAAYSFMPPSTWTKNWWNQFYLFDALKCIRSTMEPGDVLVMSDSDVIWTGADATEKMWSELRTSGAASYIVGYGDSETVNGLTRSGMAELGARLDLSHCADVVYVGGEFVGLEWAELGKLLFTSEMIMQKIFELHRSDTSIVCEEAHVLSLAFATRGFPIGNANTYVRRLWTQPLKWRNVGNDDLHLAMWHLPAEKKYGIRRLYIEYVTQRQESQLVRSCSGVDDCKTLGRWVGIPRNTWKKYARDCIEAAFARLF